MKEVPPAYNVQPQRWQRIGTVDVACFGTGAAHSDAATIRSFGEEWGKFNAFDPEEIERVGNEYFDIVPLSLLGPDLLALDLGCGSGRWSRYLASRAGHVEAIDPSDAVFHAAAAHGHLPNVRWTQAGVDNVPFNAGTFDLTICLGVLHHVPDTAGAVRKAAATLRPGGHLLLYLYYDLDGRGTVFRTVFRVSDLFRRLVHRLPGPVKRLTCDLIAWGVYVPLRTMARMAKAAAGRAAWWRRLPLSYYHDKSMTVLRNDALDRFGTPVEQRFTRREMQRMMTDAGLVDIVFSGHAPFWHALGRRA